MTWRDFDEFQLNYHPQHRKYDERLDGSDGQAVVASVIVRTSKRRAKYIGRVGFITGRASGAGSFGSKGRERERIRTSVLVIVRRVNAEIRSDYI